MYCKQCGKEMPDDAMFCKNCGVSKGVGNSYCPYCGAETPVGCEVCPNCSAQLISPKTKNPVYSGAKSRIAAGILGILLGGLGIHNFYLGYTGKAVAQLLLSVLSCGILSFASAIWGLVEGIMILTGSINTDANGIPFCD